MIVSPTVCFLEWGLLTGVVAVGTHFEMTNCLRWWSTVFLWCCYLCCIVRRPERSNDERSLSLFLFRETCCRAVPVRRFTPSELSKCFAPTLSMDSMPSLTVCVPEMWSTFFFCFQGGKGGVSSPSEACLCRMLLPYYYCVQLVHPP